MPLRVVGRAGAQAGHGACRETFSELEERGREASSKERVGGGCREAKSSKCFFIFLTERFHFFPVIKIFVYQIFQTVHTSIRKKVNNNNNK